MYAASFKHLATTRNRLLSSIRCYHLEKININEIEKKVSLRKHGGLTLTKIKTLFQDYERSKDPLVLEKLSNEIKKLPNDINPKIVSYGNNPKLISCYSPIIQLSELKEQNVDSYKNYVRLEHLGNFAGHKSYYLKGNFAAMEQSIVKASMKILRLRNFKFVSVPDILEKNTIRGCGMITDGERNQIYALSNSKYLSGTSEMALAGLYANRTINEQNLPLKIAAVSRCFRAETSGTQEERGIYRVHQFTKVEMFSYCNEKESEKLIEEFKSLQMEIFKSLKINFRLIDMPSSELGLPAYQKYDIETWIPSRKIWGEISSCSNCTDYQSSRLNITQNLPSLQKAYVHTINGTAAAIPRLIMAIGNSKKRNALSHLLKDYCLREKQNCDGQIPNLKFIKFL